MRSANVRRHRHVISASCWTLQQHHLLIPLIVDLARAPCVIVGKPTPRQCSEFLERLVNRATLTSENNCATHQASREEQPPPEAMRCLSFSFAGDRVQVTTTAGRRLKEGPLVVPAWLLLQRTTVVVTNGFLGLGRHRRWARGDSWRHIGPPTDEAVNCSSKVGSPRMR